MIIAKRRCSACDLKLAPVKSLESLERALMNVLRRPSYLSQQHELVPNGSAKVEGGRRGWGGALEVGALSSADEHHVIDGIA
jgi:hypothetical protein